MLSVSERTIEGWVFNKVHLGPKFRKIGGLRRVSEKDLAKFMEGED